MSRKKCIMASAVVAFALCILLASVPSYAASKPSTPSLKSVKSTSAGKLTVKWKKVSKAKGYQIIFATDKKYKKNKMSVTVKSAKSITKTVTGLKQGKKYYVKMRAYSKNGKKTLYSKWSKSKTATVAKKPGTPVIKSAASSSPGSLTVRWAKVNSVSGYEIQIATDSQFSQNASSVKITGNSICTINGLQNGSRYYVRVRAYKKNGSTIYGSWSTTKNVIVKGNAEGTKQPNKEPDGISTGTDPGQSGNDTGINPGTGQNNRPGGQVTPPATNPGTGHDEDPGNITTPVNNVQTVVIDNVESTSNTLTPSWEPANGAVKYQIQLGKDFDFTDLEAEVDVDAGTLSKNTNGLYEYEFNDLPPTTLYFIRIRGYNDSNGSVIYGNWSTTFSARTDIPDVDPTVWGFSASVSDTDIHKYGGNDTRQSDGSHLYKATFLSDGGHSWMNSVTFEAIDVTPKAYTEMYNAIGEKCGVSNLTEEEKPSYLYLLGDRVTGALDDSAETPVNTTTTAMSGKDITFTAGIGTRVVKLVAKKDGEILDTIYIFSKAYQNQTSNEYCAQDLDIYKRVREKIESKLWTDGMSTAEKFQALTDYINATTHYPYEDTVSKTYNPSFWEDWAVDGIALYYNMANDVILNRTMSLQGGIITCLAAELLERVGTEDLQLAYLVDDQGQIAPSGEGVWVGVGSASSNPTNPAHYTFYYRDASGTQHFYDAQGMTYTNASGKASCEQHGCKAKIIPLN